MRQCSAISSWMGIDIALPIVLTESTDVLALPEALRFGEMPLGQWLGLALLIGIAILLYRAAVKRN